MADDDPDAAPTGASDDERARAREQRIAARRQLLDVQPGNNRDLDAAASCECSCHPRPGQPVKHGGDLCSCQWTERERSEHLAEFARVVEQHRPEQEAVQRKKAEALHAAAAELEIEVSEEIPGAPWVLVGRIDGRRFYLRERWESYTIVIAPVEAPDFDPWSADADGAAVVVRSGDASDLYVAGRVDYRRALRVIAGAVRSHLLRENCAHVRAAPQDRFCSACGTLLTDLSLPERAEAAPADGVAGNHSAEGFVGRTEPEALRSGSRLREVAAARHEQRRADEALDAAVRRARAVGDSWQVIGIVLGLTAAEVRRRFDQ